MSNTIDSSVRIISNVVFVYTSPQLARPNFVPNNHTPTVLSDNPLENKHYGVTILIDKNSYDKMIELNGLTNNFLRTKSFNPEEAIEKYHLPREPESTVYPVSFRQKAMLGTAGKRYPASPIAVYGSQQVESLEGIKYYDDKDLLISNETKIGNGSIGHVQYHLVQLSNGSYLYPLAICVKDLIPYEEIPRVEAEPSAFGIRKKTNNPSTVSESRKPNKLFNSTLPSTNPWS